MVGRLRLTITFRSPGRLFPQAPVAAIAAQLRRKILAAIADITNGIHEVARRAIL
jgi:hypothetical protein